MKTMMKFIGSLIILFVALLHCTEAFIVPETGRVTSSAPDPTRTDLQNPTILAAYKKSKITSSVNGKNVSKATSKNKEAVKDDDKQGGVFSKPANLIFLPFVAIFGLDLVLNILVVAKRSIEVALTGQYTCTGPWC